MASTQSSTKKTKLKACSGISCLLAFVRSNQAIAIGIILQNSSKNCDTPIRYSLHSTWLIVWVVTQAFVYILGSIYDSFRAAKLLNIVVAVIITILILLTFLFDLAWIVVGSVWLYTSNDCKDCEKYLDFYDMWALTLAILIVSYVTAGILLCACCFVSIVVCIYGKELFKGGTDEVEPI
jgi:hypothetical protein